MGSGPIGSLLAGSMLILKDRAVLFSEDTNITTFFLDIQLYSYHCEGLTKDAEK